MTSRVFVDWNYDMTDFPEDEIPDQVDTSPSPEDGRQPSIFDDELTSFVPPIEEDPYE